LNARRALILAGIVIYGGLAQFLRERYVQTIQRTNDRLIKVRWQ
jgi:hypothetical protein